MADAAARALQLLQAGETFCLATPLPPLPAGAGVGGALIVRADGRLEGSLGTPGADEELRQRALQMLASRRKGIVEIEGGRRVFLDLLAGEAELLVCGAGHIAIPLARFARSVGFAVTVLDDRPEFAHPQRFPDCRVMAEDFGAALRPMPLGASTYAVVITRGHEHDTECLQEILPKPTAYVGLIGSRRRVQFVLQLLERDGIEADRVRQVFTPIGVPLGAESPEEIALSIVAELVCVRRQGPERARRLRRAWEEEP